MDHVSALLHTPRGNYAVKSDGDGITLSPEYRAFMGIRTEDDEIPNTPEGYANAYSASVWVGVPIRQRAKAVASIPLKFLDGYDKPLSPNHRLCRIFGAGNNSFLYTLESQRCIFGNAYAYGYRTPRGLDLQLLNPLTVEVEKSWRGIQGYMQRIDGRVVKVFPPDEVMQFPDYNPHDDLGGLSPMQYALTTINLDVNLERFAKSYFGNDATPAGLLTTENDLSPEQAEQKAALWKKMFRGVSKGFKVAVLGKSMKYQVITPPPKDLAMPELDEKTKRRLAAAWGVPPIMAFMTDAANYATAQIERLMFYTETVLPEIDFLLDIVNEQFAPLFGEGIHILPDLENVSALQEERLQKITGSTALYVNGVASLNESRAMQGLPALPVDVFLVQGVGLVKAEDLKQGILPLPPAPAPSPFSFTGSLEPPMLLEGEPLIKAAVNTAVVSELEKWQRKVAAKGVATPFETRFVYSAVADFVRMDLAGGIDPFPALLESYKAQDNELATPEEFQAYWQGIGTLYNELVSTFESAWADFPAALAESFKAGGDETAIALLLQSYADKLQAALVGTLEIPGALTKVVLAGAARGNDLLNRTLSQKASLGIAWDIINTQALAWAQQFAAGQLSSIFDTTRQAIADKTTQWIASGQPLSELAKAIEGDAQALTAVSGFSLDKLKWLSSAERAASIAQTLSTTSFTQGAFTRWTQAGVTKFTWRTQQDGVVCPLCYDLNNEVGTLETGAYCKADGTYAVPPKHVGCRCFPAPKVD